MQTVARVIVRFKDEQALYEAIGAYAQVEGMTLADAVKNLCVQGLRVPHLVGQPHPKYNPLDALLDPLIPGPVKGGLGRVQAKQIIEDAEAVIAPPIKEEPPLGAEEPEDGELPLLGYAEVDSLLSNHFRKQRKATREAAKSGALDQLFEGLEDVAGSQEVRAVEHVDPEVGESSEPARPTTEAAPVPATSAAEPYDTRPRPDVPTHAIAVREPESGAVVEVVPQRALTDSQMDRIAADLPEFTQPTRPPRPAPVDDVLVALVRAQNIR